MTFSTRSEWGAKLAKGRSPWKSKDGIAIHWAGGALEITSHEQCLATVRRWQAQHMAPGGLGARNGGVDLAYNFVACEHGHVLEGRGVDNATGANGGADANSRIAAVCYLGGVGDEIPAAGYAAIRTAVELLVRAGFRRQGFGHRDFTATTCPGEQLYARIADLVRATDKTATDLSLPPPSTHDLGDVTLRRIDNFLIEVGPDGNGWRDLLNVDRSTVVSITPLGSNPPKEGYWNVPVVACQAQGDNTRVVVSEGPPKGVVALTVWTTG